MRYREAVVRFNPSSAKGHMNLGSALQASGRIEDAISLVKMRLVKLKLPLILGMRTTTAATKTGANIWIRDPINCHMSVDVFTRPRVRSNL